MTDWGRLVRMSKVLVFEATPKGGGIDLGDLSAEAEAIPLIFANATDEHATTQKSRDRASLDPSALIDSEQYLQGVDAAALVIAGAGTEPEALALALAASKLGVTLAFAETAEGTPMVPAQVSPIALLAELIVCDPAREEHYRRSGLGPRVRAVRGGPEPALKVWIETGAPRSSRSYV